MANRTTVRINDLGWHEIKKDFEMLSKIEGIAGVQGSAGSQQVIIAATNEFGTKSAGASKSVVIPARPFIRSTVNQNQDLYKQLVGQMLINISERKGQVLLMLSRIMLKVESDIKSKITDLRTPPNAPSTIRKKKSSNPLIDKGQLRQSITSTVRQRT